MFDGLSLTPFLYRNHSWSHHQPRSSCDPDRCAELVGNYKTKVLFEKAVKSGIHPEDIIRAAAQYTKAEKENLNTPFIMQAQRWLRNKRWLDFAFVPSKTLPRLCQVFVREDTPQWKAWQKVKKTPCVNFGWYFPSEWPEGTNP